MLKLVGMPKMLKRHQKWNHPLRMKGEKGSELKRCTMIVLIGKVNILILVTLPKGCLKSTPTSFVNEKSTFHRDNAGSEYAILHVNNVQKPVRLNLYEFPSYLRLLWNTWSLCTYIDVFGIFWLLFTLD